MESPPSIFRSVENAQGAPKSTKMESKIIKTCLLDTFGHPKDAQVATGAEKGASDTSGRESPKWTLIDKNRYETHVGHVAIMAVRRTNNRPTYNYPQEKGGLPPERLKVVFNLHSSNRRCVL